MSAVVRGATSLLVREPVVAALAARAAAPEGHAWVAGCKRVVGCARNLDTVQGDLDEIADDGSGQRVAIMNAHGCAAAREVREVVDLAIPAHHLGVPAVPRQVALVAVRVMSTIRPSQEDSTSCVHAPSMFGSLRMTALTV